MAMNNGDRIKELGDSLKRTGENLAVLLERITDLEKELAQWKSNHATEVRRARILKERTDMPIERVQAYEQWGRDQARIAELEAENKKAWDKAGEMATCASKYIERVRELETQQEPVAKVDADDNGYWADILPDRDVKVGQLLYASPRPTPEEVKDAARYRAKRGLDFKRFNGSSEEAFNEGYDSMCDSMTSAMSAELGTQGEEK